MTYKYNPFWQQRIRETVRHALDVHPRLTALRVDLRLKKKPGCTGSNGRSCDIPLHQCPESPNRRLPET
ncbi:hypothetical protein L082_26872 [Escherichia coli SHECO001]|nr:hypothetical protein L082_26872 [Escherichia coli SHECO001]